MTERSREPEGESRAWNEENRPFRVCLDVEIRPCTGSDLRSLEWFGLFTAHRALFEEQFRRHLRGENLMLVADANGFPAGQVWIDLEKHADERMALLWALRVFPVLRGAGIGTRLLAAAERLARHRGFRALEIGVEKDNPAARRLYEARGYRLCGEVAEPWGYVTPDGDEVRHVSDQWMLRKGIGKEIAKGIAT